MNSVMFPLHCRLSGVETMSRTFSRLAHKEEEEVNYSVVSSIMD